MTVSKDRETPGVYVTEFDAFPPSIVGVATAVPIFIGYTQKAELSGRGVLFKPVKIASRADYALIYGGDGGTAFNLQESIQLFYANGGGSCYVVSVGDYSGAVDAAKLTQGLAAAAEQAGPTMIVIPDAVLLPADPPPPPAAKPGAPSPAPAPNPLPAIARSKAFATLVRAMLAQCGTLRDRVALLDLYGAEAIDTASPKALQDGLDACVTNFREDVGEAHLGYGMAYFPPLRIVLGAAGRLLPPSGAMAGIYTMIDDTRGVWSAPANVIIDGIAGLSLSLDNDQQGPLNMPLDGKAINAIRNFVGRGPVVWGARTLDGNSLDWRYIQVRRTILYIEQSIKTALNPFVFAANDGATWTTATSMISSFLQQLWAQGGLMGDKASDAFTVQCGLGSTMTGQDILDGYMIVNVTLQMIRPAEFIALTFKQQMRGVT
ncbi:MAG TPA: phage tail sheath C-terminal domain-containing protein [Rhizomicrobium sp.]